LNRGRKKLEKKKTKENHIELKKLSLAGEQESYMGEPYIPNTKKLQQKPANLIKSLGQKDYPSLCPLSEE